MAIMISVPGYVTEFKGEYQLNVSSLGICEDLDNNELDTISEMVIKRLQIALNCEIEECLVVPYQPIFKSLLNDNITRFTLELKEWDKIITYVLNKEPLIDSSKPKKTKKNSHLHEASSEEVINLGYPEV